MSELIINKKSCSKRICIAVDLANGANKYMNNVIKQNILNKQNRGDKNAENATLLA